ncbi:MAG: hypothetical protein WC340_08405 [Kiritimatiellia bacterium]
MQSQLPAVQELKSQRATGAAWQNEEIYELLCLGTSELQAIARVNRLFAGKEYGVIMDYSGVLDKLGEAIDFYARLAEYDHDDLVETVTMISEQTSKLPQLHSDLWNVFTAVKGSTDTEVYQEHLRYEMRRNRFYERFSAFARAMGMALASTTFLEHTPAGQIDRYKKDLKFFRNLRADASIRFQKRVDFSEYEPRIKKLLDTHVGALEVEQLIEPFDLLNTEQRERSLNDEGRSDESKADMIAASTRHSIEHGFEKDPAFFQKFSRMLEDVLAALHSKRLQAAEALEIVRRIDKHKIRDWKDNYDALNQMRREIDDIIFEITQEQEVSFPLAVQDKLIDQCIEIAIANDFSITGQRTKSTLPASSIDFTP